MTNKGKKKRNDERCSCSKKQVKSLKLVSDGRDDRNQGKEGMPAWDKRMSTKTVIKNNNSNKRTHLAH